MRRCDRCDERAHLTWVNSLCANVCRDCKADLAMDGED